MKHIRRLITVISIINFSLFGILYIGNILGLYNLTDIVGKVTNSCLFISIAGFISINIIVLLEKKFNIVWIIIFPFVFVI